MTESGKGHDRDPEKRGGDPDRPENRAEPEEEKGVEVDERTVGSAPGGPDGHDGQDPQPSGGNDGRNWGDVFWIGLLLVFLVFAFATLITLLINLWPIVSAQVGADDPPPVGTVDLLLGGSSVRIAQDGALILLAAVAGALGAFLHAATSLTDFVGNRRFQGSWTAWYFLRLPVGAALAVLFYLVIRAGFITGNAGSDVVNPYGIAAIAALAGMFAKQATDKLREVFETLFKVADGKGDDERADNLANPKPVLREINPRRAEVGRKNPLELALHGQQFMPESKVFLGAKELRATYVGPRRLGVKLDPDAFAKAHEYEVTVQNPGPGGGTSEARRLLVSPS